MPQGNDSHQRGANSNPVPSNFLLCDIHELTALIFYLQMLFSHSVKLNYLAPHFKYHN